MDQTSEIQQKSVSFYTLGCRLNSAETGEIAEGFQQRGYKIRPFGESVDITFINTCTVTDQADSSCRNLIRKAHRSSPEGKVVVAGCYAQMDAPRLNKMPEVDLVLGTQQKYKVFDFIEEENENEVSIDRSAEFFGAATSLESHRTRAFLKIQDGCNYVCSFCIIPFARGRSRTITVQDAITQANDLVAKGFKEIVLTGVNIGEYNSTSKEDLADMVRYMGEIKGLERLRLGSVEPNTFSAKLIRALKETGKYQEHFHIPLQSGSDEILKSMKRKYDISQYKEVQAAILEEFPTASFGADVIVGFPGESEKNFLETYEFLKASPITHFHVFPYSQRKNTVAAKMEGHLNSEIKKERVKSLIALGEDKLAGLLKSKVGSTQSVLWEQQHEGVWSGLTPNYLRVKMTSSEKLHNQIKRVKITESSTKELTANHLM